MEINVIKFSYLLFFVWFSITILSYTLTLTVSQFQTEQLMTLQIR